MLSGVLETEVVIHQQQSFRQPDMYRFLLTLEKNVYLSIYCHFLRNLVKNMHQP